MEKKEYPIEVHQRRLKRHNENKIPTILVEGDADTLLISWLTDGNTQAVYYCGGIGMLLKIVEEIQKNPTDYAYIRLFMADRDMTLFLDDRTETQKNTIFYTKGYSLENDLYEDAEKFIDSKMIYSEIKNKKKILFENLSKYFAFVVENYRKTKIKPNFTEIKLRNQYVREHLDLPPNLLQRIGFYEPQQELFEEIKANYALMIRGHILFEAIAELYYMKEDIDVEKVEKDEVKTKTIREPKYREEQILLDCFAYAQLHGENIKRIKKAIEEALKK